jgi:hypothetical protein
MQTKVDHVAEPPLDPSSAPKLTQMNSKWQGSSSAPLRERPNRNLMTSVAEFP